MRADIQMLRGVAVLLVVLFHLGFPAFASGFLGVDVFFVISGYLMAVMYDPKQKLDFYRKRAKRLLPAYAATVIVTLLAALAITTPNDFGQVALQGWFATFFASNIGFWLENSYFDKAAFKPLLHLWSLGVEIQFYLLVPALYWALKKTRLAGYALMVAGSAALCFWMLGLSPKTSFFWLPLRLWEFLLGFGVATYITTRPKQSGLAWVGAAGFVIILLVPVIPVQGDTLGFLRGHPGASALVITLATAAVLIMGLPAALENNPVAKGLQRLGDWSYSVYLAHFPVIVLALYHPFSGTVLKANSISQFALVLALVVGASALLYFGVEKRFRHAQLRMRWAAVAVAAVAVLAVGGPVLQNLPLSPTERAVFAAWEDRDAYRCGKFARIAHPLAKTCELTGLPSPSARILLLGNSHADSLKHTLAQAAAAKNTAVYLTVDNSPLMPGGMAADAVVQQAVAMGASALVLHHSPGAMDAKGIEQVAALAHAKGIRTSLVMPVPVRKDSVPRDLWLAQHGRPMVLTSMQDYVARNGALQEGVAAIRVPGFKVYEVAHLFCKSACSVAAPDGRPYYFDGGHLTLTGSAVLRPVLDEVVRATVAEPTPAAYTAGSPSQAAAESSRAQPAAALSRRTAPAGTRQAASGAAASWISRVDLVKNCSCLVATALKCSSASRLSSRLLSVCASAAMRTSSRTSALPSSLRPSL